ncbi:polysaccharide pyruvyl transferase family protein [Verrucomicrobia bacterium S94]|nr:polysaccharide pyruvyl transferase family protein [Verrucomicrobia bacterium S94]
MNVKVGLITTVDTNIGDDFIREGILLALGEAISKDLEITYVNKHVPGDIYPRFHPLYWVKYLPKGRVTASRFLDGVMNRFHGSRFEDCDLVIQCGAPVFFNKCSQAEWAKIIWEHILCRLGKRIPVLNLAAGSCYPWERIPENHKELNTNDAYFIEKITKACALTMVRDRLSKQLLEEMQLEAQQQICSAFLAGRKYKKKTADAKFVFFNYMQGGGHFDFGQNIDTKRWETTVRSIIEQVRKSHPVACICHDQKEFHLAGQLFPDIPRFFPRTVEEYFNLAALGIAGVFNRMHAAVAFAGMGIPSVAVGTDSRMLMVKELSMPVYYVKDADAQQICSDLERMLKARDAERDRLTALSDNVFLDYVERIRGVIFDAN